jgi:secondary thiamine-phosphate synthase enzyme
LIGLLVQRKRRPGPRRTSVPRALQLVRVEVFEPFRCSNPKAQARIRTGEILGLQPSALTTSPPTRMILKRAMYLNYSRYGFSMKTEHLKIETKGNTDIIDITERVRDVLSRSNIKNGMVSLFVTGSTAALTVMEFEPGTVKDLQEFFEKTLPKDSHYHHHERWHDDNGHSHAKASLIGPSLVVPFSDGRLVLGTWQQIALIDFDTSPRQRVVVVQAIGE